MTTAVMTRHARERCEEMGISTKVAKRIVAKAETTYPGPQNARGRAIIAFYSGEPEYAAVFAPQENGQPPVVLTVLFRCEEDYVRAGRGRIPLAESA